MIDHLRRPAAATALAVSVLALLASPAGGAVASGEPFPTAGTYVYLAAGQELGRETFSTAAGDAGPVIRSRTRLDLETYLLDQTSEMTVDPDGALIAISLRGNSGGKPFGLTARVVGSVLTLQDTVQGIATVVDYPEPLAWIAGNFMQHLLHAFRLYDRGRGGTQTLATQAGELVIEPLGPAFMTTPGGDVAVDLFRLGMPAGEVEMAVQDDGGVPLITVPAQGVAVRRLDALEWRLLPRPDPDGPR
jgi:hypothetical protein